MKNRTIFLLVFGLFLYLVQYDLHAATKYSTGNGDWNDNSSWSDIPGGAATSRPGNNDNAVIREGDTITVNGDRTIVDLDISGVINFAARRAITINGNAIFSGDITGISCSSGGVCPRLIIRQSGVLELDSNELTNKDLILRFSGNDGGSVSGYGQVGDVDCDRKAKVNPGAQMTIHKQLRGTGTLFLDQGSRVIYLGDENIRNIDIVSGPFSTFEFVSGARWFGNLDADTIGATVIYRGPVSGGDCLLKQTEYWNLTIATTGFSGLMRFVNPIQVKGDLFVDAGATFPIATDSIDGLSKDIVVEGETRIDGTIQIPSEHNTRIFNDFIINPGGRFDNFGNGDVTITGNLVNNGTFIAGLGSTPQTPDYYLTGPNDSLMGDSAITIPNMIVTGSYTNNHKDLFTIVPVIPDSGSLFQGMHSKLTFLNSDLNGIIGVFDASAQENTVVIEGQTGNHFLPGVLFFNLEIQTIHPDTTFILVPTEVGGDFTIKSGLVQLDNVRLSCGRNWHVESSAPNQGWSSKAEPVVAFEGTGTVYHEAQDPVNGRLNNVEIVAAAGGSGRILTHDLEISGEMWIHSGGRLEITPNMYTVTVGKSFLLDPGGNFNPRRGKVVFAELEIGNLRVPADFDFYDLEVNKDDTTSIVQLLSDVRVSNLLDMQLGILELGNFNLIQKRGSSVIGSMTGYVMADQLGEYRIERDGTGSFTFHVGGINGNQAEYGGFTVHPKPSVVLGPNAYFSMRSKLEQHPELIISDHFIKRHWILNANDVYLLNYDVEYNYYIDDVIGIEERIMANMWTNRWSAHDLVELPGRILRIFDLNEVGEFTGATECDQTFDGRAGQITRH